MKRSDGFSLIEMMVSILILAILGAVILSFLNQQSRLARYNEVRSEVQANLRVAMELVSTDIINAGSTRAVTPSCNRTLNHNFSVNPALRANMTRLPGFGNDVAVPARKHNVVIRYCEPYETDGLNPIRRQVAYFVANDPISQSEALHRITYNAAGTSVAQEFAVAPNIVGFALEFRCREGAPSAIARVNTAEGLLLDPSWAPPRCDPTNVSWNGGQDVVSVTIRMAARSRAPVSGISGLGQYWFNGVRITAEEEAGFYYEYAEQKVVPPNLGFQ